MKRKGGGLGGSLLGRGKGSDVENVAANLEAFGADVETLRSVPPAEIGRSPWQPRTELRAGELEELADSIRAHGVLEPLLGF